MATPADDLRQILENNGVATFQGDMFVGEIPASTECITLFDTGGFPRNEKNSNDRPTIQIMAAYYSYLDGYNILEEIDDLLTDDNDSFTISNRRYLFWKQQEPTHLEEDSEERHMWSINFRAQREYL